MEMGPVGSVPVLVEAIRFSLPGMGVSKANRVRSGEPALEMESRYLPLLSIARPEGPEAFEYGAPLVGVAVELEAMVYPEIVPSP